MNTVFVFTIFVAIAQLEGAETRCSIPETCENLFVTECIDCNTQIINNNGKIYKQRCPSRTPYCNKLTRKCQQQNTCSGFLTCKYPGIFPNPVDCTKYYNCDSWNQEPKTYQCPPRSVYDHSKHSCSFDSPCITFETTKPGLCHNKPYQIVSHPFDESIYTVCPEAGDINLETCDNSNDTINVNTKQCGFQCPNEGIFPNINDKSSFYICWDNSGEIIAIPLSCGDGVFSMEEFGCVWPKPELEDPELPPNQDRTGLVE